MIGKGSYDLLLLDVVMPGMNGCEVLSYLQANPPPAALPVIALSASDDSAQVARCIEAGAEDYLCKPFEPSLLQARIDSCLEKKRLRDREILHLHAIEKERERADDLLHVILPANVAAELKATRKFRPRRVEGVAILFADVVGFTGFCEKRDPEVIYRELQTLVKELEMLTTAHGMEKIKTIGDAFLSAAGLLNQFGNPALDCVRCGLAMIEMAEGLPLPWRLRVGIHVGPVVAGIVGRQRYQFDVWGDTVNQAARMQAEAPAGGLCVTRATWELLEPRCVGTSLGSRLVKGKGRQEVFEVTAVKG
jgi:class 3 adenylate cyclase